MLRLPRFDLHRVAALDEALALLAEHGDGARLVAGGTDLWPNMKRRHQTARVVISLMGIASLRGISTTEDGALRIGATTPLAEVADDPQVRERFPALARAVLSISSPPLRNMGTLGGNLCLDTRCTYYNQTEEWRRAIDYCMKEAGSVCWVAPSSSRCWAHSASDAAPLLMALDARVTLVSRRGERTVPLAALYRNDGIDYLAKRPDEILLEILLPAGSDASRCRATFWKLRRRGSIDFAVLSVAAAVWLDDRQRVGDARLVLGAVASQPLPVPAAGEMLRGKALEKSDLAAVAAAARRLATPLDNTDFRAQWRGLMTARYTEAALRELAGLTPHGLAPRHAL